MMLSDSKHQVLLPIAWKGQWKNLELFLYLSRETKVSPGELRTEF